MVRMIVRKKILIFVMSFPFILFCKVFIVFFGKATAAAKRAVAFLNGIG